MRKENGKRESPYKGILKFADEKKPQLSFAVVLSVLSSAFGIVPYIAVAILLQKALASSLTTTWAILLPVIALCGYLLKHTLYAKSTLCSHTLDYITKQLILAGVDPETAEQDACGIEHAVSSESFQKLKKAFDDS